MSKTIKQMDKMNWKNLCWHIEAYDKRQIPSVYCGELATDNFYHLCEKHLEERKNGK